MFDLEKKQFLPRDYTGTFEIVSLTGTIDSMGGDFYCHLHMSAADETGQVFGGHLSRAVAQRHLRDGHHLHPRPGGPPPGTRPSASICSSSDPFGGGLWSPSDFFRFFAPAPWNFPPQFAILGTEKSCRTAALLGGM